MILLQHHFLLKCGHNPQSHLMFCNFKCAQIRVQKGSSLFLHSQMASLYRQIRPHSANTLLKSSKSESEEHKIVNLGISDQTFTFLIL